MVTVSSCKVQKFLKEGEYLVNKVKIEVNSQYDDVNKDWLANGLSYFVDQKENKGLIPKEYIYFSHNEPNDTSKYDRIMRNVFGVVPSIYDESITKQTAERMKSWLRFNKGFYNAEVTYSSNTRRYKTDVVYTAEIGKRYKYGDVTFISVDTSLINEVRELWSKGPIITGSPVDGDAFNNERNRITTILQNKGYADFATKYIDVKGDSTGGDFIIDLFVEVYPPENELAHKIYNVGKITVYTDYYNKQDTFSLITDTIESVIFKRESHKYLVKPSVINAVLLFREGERANKDARLKTFNKLSSLGSYRFTGINPKFSESDSNTIDYDVLLTPYPRKWIADYGADLLYSRLGSSSGTPLSGRNIFGLSLNGQLINRNFLGGSERYTLTGEIGGQLELASPFRLRSYNYGLSNYIEYPIFKDHLGQIKLLHKMGFVRNSSYVNLQEKALSTVNLSFSNTDFRNLYQIFIINATYGYKLSDQLDRSLTINTLGLTLNSYELRDSFKVTTGIARTFQDNLFTGFLFRNLIFTKNGSFKDKSYQWSFISNFELSGLEILGANRLSNLISGTNDVWSLNDNRFNYAKFTKLELDGRFYKNLGRKNVVATRINAGIIVPIADTENSPFIKQFDAGGPNSLRGWGIRELGPGGVRLIQNSPNFIPFQKGDIKLEANVEYRFPIWGVIRGGTFLDVGNIWTIKGDEIEGQFTSAFLKQIAVATGWGIRFDFDYFLIRFDFGYRLRNPYRSLDPDTYGKYWNNWQGIKSQGIGNFQVNVNHAF